MGLPVATLPEMVLRLDDMRNMPVSRLAVTALPEIVLPLEESRMIP
jgi:hypothetical protein